MQISNENIFNKGNNNQYVKEEKMLIKNLKDNNSNYKKLAQEILSD